jgi:hypothetical protein
MTATDAEQERLANAIAEARTLIRSRRHGERLDDALDELVLAADRAGVSSDISDCIGHVSKAIGLMMWSAPSRDTAQCAVFVLGSIEHMLDWDCGK